MTDGRIPGKWTNDPKFMEMDWVTWGVLTRAIAWCNENGTDGLIQTRWLTNLSPDGTASPTAYNDLVKRGLWVKVDGGYQFNNWTVKSHQGGLGQSSAESVRTGKAKNAKKQQDYRDRKKATPPRNPVTLPGDVGQDRTGTGQDRLNREDVISESEETDSLDENEEVAPCCGGDHSSLSECPMALSD